MSSEKDYSAHVEIKGENIGFVEKLDIKDGDVLVLKRATMEKYTNEVRYKKGLENFFKNVGLDNIHVLFIYDPDGIMLLRKEED